MFSLNNPSRRRTVKILTIGNYSVMILDIIQGLLFVPLYLHFIGTKLYGLWLGTGGVISALSFLDLGLATLIIQRISREYGKKDFNGVGKYFFSGIMINIFFLTILLILGFIASYKLDIIFHYISLRDNQILTKAFQFALIALVLLLLNNSVEGTLNALQTPLFGKITLFTGALIGLLVTFLLLHGRNPLMAIPIGLLIRAIIPLVANIAYLMLIFVHNNIRLFSIQRRIIKDYLKLTPSLMLSKFGTSLIGNIEPTLINIFIAPQIAVYYSVTKKAGQLIVTVLNRIGGVLYPSFAHLHAESNLDVFKKYFIKVLNIIFPIALTMFISYFILNKFFVQVWVGIGNFLGNEMTFLIAIALLISFFSNFLSYLLSTTGDIKYTNIAVFSESMSKMIFLFLLTKYVGVVGLPIAIILASTFFIIIYLKRWNKHLLLKRHELKRLKKKFGYNILSLIVTGSIIYFLLVNLKIQNIYGFIELSLIVVFVLIFFLIVTDNELRIYFLNRFKLFIRIGNHE